MEHQPRKFTWTALTFETLVVTPVRLDVPVYISVQRLGHLVHVMLVVVLFPPHQIHGPTALVAHRAAFHISMN